MSVYVCDLFFLHLFCVDGENDFALSIRVMCDSLSIQTELLAPPPANSCNFVYFNAKIVFFGGLSFLRV